MVKILFTITLCILTGMSTAATAAPALIVDIDSKNHELGRPIRVQVYALSVNEKLSQIDLSSLDKDFGVVTESVISSLQDARWPGTDIQALNLKLYPRRAGKIILPSLTFSGVHSVSHHMTISQGETTLPVLRVSNNNPWQREQVTVHVDIDSPHSSVQLESENTGAINKIEIIPLKHSTQKHAHKTTYTIGWAIAVLAAGEMDVKLPVIKYSVNGVLRKRFYLPDVNFSVKPLPSYLPPTLPVGTVSVSSDSDSFYFTFNNNLKYWNIKLSSPVMSTYWLPPVLKQIKSNNDIQYSAISTGREITSSEHRISSEVTYNIPYKTLKNGLISLPGIKLQYFDPVKGILVSREYTAPNIISVSYLFAGIIILLSVIIFIIVAKKITALTIKSVSHKKSLRLSLDLIEQAASLAAVRHALDKLIQAHDWPDNLSLHQLNKYWERSYRDNNSFEQAIKLLAGAYYGGKNISVDEVKEKFLSAIKYRKRI